MLSDTEMPTRPRPSRTSWARRRYTTRYVASRRTTITTRIQSVSGYPIATAKANALGAPARTTAPSEVDQVTTNSAPTTTSPSRTSTGRDRGPGSRVLPGVRSLASTSSAAKANTGSVKYPTSASDGLGRGVAAKIWYHDQMACPALQPHIPTPTSTRQVRSTPCRCRAVHRQATAPASPAGSCAEPSTTGAAPRDTRPELGMATANGAAPVAAGRGTRRRFGGTPLPWPAVPPCPAGTLPHPASRGRRGRAAAYDLRAAARPNPS